MVALRWALTTNPRGWCVVGVETAAQLEELCQWREELLS
jgi:aryl-alcohol dehydrogenase-like predicted oxidoreductase